MKNYRKFLMGMLTVVLVALVGCGNTSDKSMLLLGNQAQNKNSIQNVNDDQSKVESIEVTSNAENTDTDTIDTNNNNENEDTTKNIPAKEENLSTNATASLKEEYLKKLNDTKKEVEEIRKNYSDDTSTYAMKKVEGDRYDLWDELLNEIYGILKEQLPIEEMNQLRKEQTNWIKYRDDTSIEASLKYKGGTVEHLEY